MKILLSLLLSLATLSQAVASTPCTPVEPDAHTQGFWRHVARGTHPSGEHERIPGYLSCIQSTQTFRSVTTTKMVSDELNPNPANSKEEQARSQFMAMVLNLCSGRAVACNCVIDPDLGAHTLGELVAIVDQLLSNPNRTQADLLLAQAVADRINNGRTFVECPTAYLPPNCQGDTYSTNWDNAIVTTAANGVLANDSDPNGLPLTVSLETAPTSGTLVLNADGSFTYVPQPYVSGVDTFSYTVSNGFETASCLVTINVTPGSAPPVPPVCDNDTYSTDWATPLVVDAAVGLLANDYDPNGDAVTAALDTAPSRGTVEIDADGGFIYYPEPNFVGQVTFTYKVCDATRCSLCTVTIDVISANLPPVCEADLYSIPWNLVLTSPAPGVLINDSDPNGDVLTASLVSGPSSGSFTLNPDGSFVYTPVACYVGTVSYVYEVSDGLLTSSCTGTISVIPAPAPQMLPVCEGDYYTTNWDTRLNVPAPGILANDYDPNANTISAHLHRAPERGQLLLNPDGSFTYIPVQGVAGQVSFVYRAWDGYGYSLCTVTIDVTPGNLAPVCGPESYTVQAGTRLVVNAPGVLGNDYDPEGAPLRAQGTAILPSVGKLGLNADGSFWYDAPAGFSGTVSFVYSANDGITKTFCTVYITVVP